MLWVFAIVLGLMWGFAMVSSQTFGGFVHILIAAAIVMIIVQVLKTRQDNKFSDGNLNGPP